MTAVEDRPTTEAPAKEVGQARRRKEDARLITGKTTWTDNMVLPGMLHLAVVRSPVAHAKLLNVDVEAATRRGALIEILRAEVPLVPGVGHAERRPDVLQVVLHNAAPVLGDERVEGIAGLEIGEVRPGAEYAQRAQLAAVLVWHDVVRIVGPRACAPARVS